MSVNVAWTEFKSINTSFANLPMAYLEDSEKYDIWQQVNGREFICVIKKTSPASSDQTDWQNNYKTGANTDGLWSNVAITSARELKVSSPPPVAPTGTTQMTLASSPATLNMTGTDNQYSYFVIPNGTTLHLQSLYMSFEGNATFSKVEIYDDPTAANPTGPNNGDTIPGTWVLIDIAHISNDSRSIPLNDITGYLGNGTRRIALRRKRMDAGLREFYARLLGYYS
jgi:hypothetical protein